MKRSRENSDRSAFKGNWRGLSGSVWRTAPDVPLDLNGPTDRPFRRFEEGQLSLPIHETFRDVARRHPDRVAVTDGVAHLTYAELDASVSRVAIALRSIGDAGGAIGILLPNSVLFSVASLACLTTGRPFIPLDLRYPVEHNLKVIVDSGLATLIVENETATADYRLPESITLIRLDRVLQSGTSPVQVSLGSEIDLDAPAVILYTSGSTGRPKGIVNSQRALLQRVAQHVNSGHLNCDDTFLPLSSPCTIAGLREALAPLLVGGMLYALDPQTVGLREIRRLMRETPISVCWCVPVLFRALMAIDDDRADFQSLRIFRIGGERILATDIELLRQSLPSTCFIQIGYSSTETPGTQFFVPQDAIQDSAVVPVGYMLPETSYTVLREDGSPAPLGELGELVVRSRSVALGQWADGRLVDGAMVSDPSDPSRRIYPVGDLVSVDERGLITVAGRKDRQIKVRGVRVEPAELEVALRRSPEVSEAAVIVRSAGTTNSLVAFVTPLALPYGGSMARNELVSKLRARIRATLPGALQPSAIHVLTELPKLPGGKIDGVALQQIDRERLASAATLPVDTGPSRSQAIQRAVTQSWKRVLGAHSLALHQTWEEAGGDSLTFLTFVFDLENALGRRLAIDIFDPAMRAEDMAAAIRDSLLTPATTQTDNREPIFVCPGVLGDEPALAALRAEMGEAYRLVTVSYPDMAAMTADGFTFHDIISYALEQISAVWPPGPVRLFGYSFGGVVAFALAQRLLAAGHEIGFLGILDTDVSHGRVGHDVRFEEFRIPRLVDFLRRKNLRDNILRGVAKGMVHCDARFLLRRLTGRRGTHISAKSRYAIHGWASRYIRVAAAQRYLQSAGTDRLPRSLTLFRSAQPRPAAEPDLGWGSYAAAVKVLALPGDHQTVLLEADNRRTLAAAIREALGSLETLEGA
ncbi:MAG: AMP-binding protein [Acetobacteraceae bacterium]|nr:AMP-binding protein [Acetobacteraceae bacterium]